MHVMPSQPQTERRMCQRQRAPAKSGRADGRSSTNSRSAQSAKKNLPALTCRGLRPKAVSPGSPSAFASSEVAATSAPEASIRKMATQEEAGGAMATLFIAACRSTWPAKINEPINRSDHQAAADKVSGGGDDNVVNCAGKGQRGIGRGVLTDGDPEFGLCPFLQRQAIGQEIEIGNRVFEPGGNECRDWRNDEENLVF